MASQFTIRTVALGLILVSGTAHAGLFGKKKQPPPPPPEPAPVVVPVAPPPPPPPIPLEFSGVQTEAPVPTSLDRVQSASPEVLATLQWVAASKDNAGLPFIVVDKANARAYAFNPAAQLKATAPVLLGMGVGDVVLVSPDAPMSAIPEHKRITPAGRYPSRLVTDTHGKTVVLIDGPNLITMHIVAKGTPAQRRAERLASVTSEDNRVSFGCINVPPAFFTTVVDPDFRPGKGIVYVLPEKTTAGQLFGFQPAVTAPVTAPLTAPVLQAPLTASLSPASAPAPMEVNFGPTTPAPASAVVAPAVSSAPITAPITAASAPVEAPSTSAVPADGAAAVSAPDAR
jgi:hypothetical protein